MNKTGSFSNANGDGNENVKTTTFHVQHTFLYDFFDVKFSHAMFYGGRWLIHPDEFFLLFLDLVRSPRIQFQENSPIFDILSESE